jgi:hypothetical protein
MTIGWTRTGNAKPENEGRRLYERTRERKKEIIINNLSINREQQE